MSSSHPPTVAFIDNHLPKYHPIFATSSVIYDPMAHQYVPTSQSLVPGSSKGIVASGSSVAPASNTDPPPRPVHTEAKAMQFWNDIFSAAKGKFLSTAAPKGRSETAYHIRDKPDWDSVYDTLISARQKYEQKGGSVGQRLRKVWRKTADNITPGVEVAKFASNVTHDPYITPVLGAVEVIFDAIKTASDVRIDILDSLDGLGVVPIFSDVELFLATFPKDENIERASIAITTTTLSAVEQVIGFFISSSLSRASKAIFMGNDYQKALLGSLAMIQTKSKELLHEAFKSHMFQVEAFSHETRKFYAETREMQKKMEMDQELLLKGQQKMESTQQLTNQMLEQGFNGMLYLFIDAHEKRRIADEERAAVEQRRWIAAEQTVQYLRAEVHNLRVASPAPPQVMDWYIRKDVLLQMFGPSDDTLADVAFVMDKKEQLPAREQALPEQIIATELFQKFFVSSSSAKLLVHWDAHPKTIAGVSSLSLFCVTLTQALRGKPRFMLALFFCGLHTDPLDCGGLVGARALLTSLIIQLLTQYDFDTRPLHQEVDFASLQDGGTIEALTKLLLWLLRHLPQSTTLILLIDGVALFEREEFEDEALDVFEALILIAGDGNVPASVKLLFTSTPGTETIRGAFEEEDLILNVDALPRLGLVPSEERMERELVGEFGGDGGGPGYA